jgi:peptidyl-tRNA hydrolase
VTTASQPLDRFYVVVRSDLPPGLQAAQAVHSAIQFTQEWPDLLVPWYTDSNYLVIVAVPDEPSLWEMAKVAREQNIRYSITQEPDLDDKWTAVALQPGDMARMICSCLPLALKEAEEPQPISF